MASQPYEYHGMMAKYWDLLRGDTSAWEDRAMFLELIRKYGQPVLDVGCASGRLILDFASLGIDIDGVDVSPEMIDLCELNAARKNLKLKLYTRNMTELDLLRKYRTIMVPSSSFQLLLKPGEPQKAMKRFLDHLEPGGVLVLPFMTLWLSGDPLDSGFTQEAIRPEDGALIRRTAWARYNPETKTEDTHDLWEVIKNGVVLQSEVHAQSPATLSYTLDEALALFEEAGFKDVQAFHEFTFDPVKPGDTLFTLVGAKP